MFLPDNSTISDTVTLTDNLLIDQIEVILDISHTYIGDLVVSLTSPGGTESLLVNRPGKSASSFWGSSQNDIDSIVSSTNHFGETSAGTWTLTLSDHYGADPGVLNSWSQSAYGDTITGDDTYVYTDEFSDFSGGADSARRVLDDAGGSDWINAAAITSDIVFNLAPGASNSLAGNALALSATTTIENMVGGATGTTPSRETAPAINCWGRGGMTR